MGIAVEIVWKQGIETKRELILTSHFATSDAHVVSWLLFLLPDLAYLD